MWTSGRNQFSSVLYTKVLDGRAIGLCVQFVWLIFHTQCCVILWQREQSSAMAQRRSTRERKFQPSSACHQHRQLSTTAMLWTSRRLVERRPVIMSLHHSMMSWRTLTDWLTTQLARRTGSRVQRMCHWCTAAGCQHHQCSHRLSIITSSQPQEDIVSIDSMNFTVSAVNNRPRSSFLKPVNHTSMPRA